MSVPDDDMVKRVRSSHGLTPAQRLHNVIAHTEKLKEVLDSQAPKEATQRIFRARAIVDDDFIVITLLQNLSNYQPAAGQPDIKLHLFVDRPYYTAGASGMPVSQMMLVGQYALDEVVAFLALDKVDTANIEWVDETKYSKLVVVGDILRKLH